MASTLDVIDRALFRYSQLMDVLDALYENHKKMGYPPHLELEGLAEREKKFLADAREILQEFKLDGFDVKFDV